MLIVVVAELPAITVAGEGAVAASIKPVPVVLSSTNTLPAPFSTRSGLPSAFISATATNDGIDGFGPKL